MNKQCHRPSCWFSVFIKTQKGSTSCNTAWQGVLAQVHSHYNKQTLLQNYTHKHTHSDIEKHLNHSLANHRGSTRIVKQIYKYHNTAWMRRWRRKVPKWIIHYHRVPSWIWTFRLTAKCDCVPFPWVQLTRANGINLLCNKLKAFPSPWSQGWYVHFWHLYFK